MSTPAKDSPAKLSPTSLQTKFARDHGGMLNSTLQAMLSRPQQTIRSVKGSSKADLAGHLPFDILSQVFEEYLLQETAAYPVETLLLVCRSWSQAALDHTRLWSTFTMCIEEFHFWEHRIVRRLRRCPSDSLLDIEIYARAPGIRAPGIRAPGIRAPGIMQTKIVESVFRTLAGPNGRGALRWRKFKVNDDRNHLYDKAGRSIIDKFCGYPTPNLRELEIKNFVCFSRIFPETPSLKVFSSHNVSTPYSPDLTSAIEVDIGMDTGFTTALARAVNIRKLKLTPTFASQRNQVRYQLVDPYRRLTALHLSPGLCEGGLDKFSAPALRELSLNLTRESEFREVASCKGIPFHQLTTILVEQKTPTRWSGIALRTYCEGLHHFLQVVNSVEILRVEDAIPQNLVLKLLVTDLRLLCHEPGVFLSVGGCKVKLEQGEDRLGSVTRIRGCVENIFNGTWDEIYKELALDWV